MGIFDFLKGLLKEEEQEEKEFNLKEFETWFESFLKDKTASADDKVKDFNEKIDAAIEKTKEALENLENAKLKNPNIPERAKHMMEGNRSAYILKINMLLDRFEKPKSFSEAGSALAEFKNGLDILTKSTQKTYMVLQEFFANESRNVALGVRQIKDFLEQLESEIKKEGINELGEIKKELEKIKRNISHKEMKKEEIKKSKSKIAEKEKQIEELKKELEKLRQSSDFKNLTKLKDDRDKTNESLHQLESRFMHQFSAIERSLKKFERMTLDETLVRKYLEKPVTTLLHDDELKFIGILQKMREQIEQNNIELKDRKKEKTIGTIKVLTKEYLLEFSNNYEKTKERLKNADEKISAMTVEKDVEEVKNKIDLAEHELKTMKNSIQQMQEETDTQNISNILDNVSKRIEEKYNIKISINAQ